jgi:hypothetical protein
MRDYLPTDMTVSAVSLFIVAPPSLEIPEGFINYSVLVCFHQAGRSLRMWNTPRENEYEIIREEERLNHNFKYL